MINGVVRWLLNVEPSSPGEIRLVEELGPRGRRRALIGTATISAVLLVAFAWVIRRFQIKGQFASELWTPFKIWGTWRYLLLGLVNTLKAAGISLALALVIGIAMALWRSSERKSVRVAASIYVEGFRACALVLLIIFFFYQLSKWFNGWSLQRYAFVAVIIGLTLYYSTVLAEVIRSGIRSIPKGQLEAGLSIGLTPSRALRTIILPQAIRRALPNIITQSASLLKDTSLGYLVTYDELLKRADIAGEFSDNKLQTLLVAGIMYIAVIAVLTSTANAIQRRQIKTVR
jgi:glutamate transport system permease protein